MTEKTVTDQTTFSWLASWRVYVQPASLRMLFLGFAAGLPLLLVLGTLMDMSPLILILTPILLPVVKLLGVDPVHFGMIMMVNLGIGLITPPVGAVLFVGSAVAKLRIGEVTKAMMPFFVALFTVLLMVTYLPWLSLWLPRTMGL